jgi:hypothetical protein
MKKGEKSRESVKDMEKGQTEGKFQVKSIKLGETGTNNLH